MIHLYTWNTPNGIKPVIMLEELGVPYRLHGVDLSTGAQKQDDFLSANPNGRIPALIDTDRQGDAAIGGVTGMRVFESGAILIHLAEVSGRFLPTEPAARAETVGWVFWQVGGLGPMVGQLHWFENNDPDGKGVPRFRDETARLLDILDHRLTGRDYLAAEYSIADMMCWAWARAGAKAIGGSRPALDAWIGRVKARPAVIAAREKAKALES